MNNNTEERVERMSILIDADVVRTRITEDWFLDILLTQESKREMKNCLLNMIDSTPLAYSVEEATEIMQQYWKKSAVEFARTLMEEIKKRNFSLGEILGFEKMMGDLLKEMGCCDDIG